MKILFLLIHILLFSKYCFGQDDFEYHLVTRSVESPTSVFYGDLDGDGDIDILSSSDDDDKIAWYENLNSKGQFGSQKIISRNADRPFHVYACDIDGDQDLDVLSASIGDDKVAWYENDGNGNFGEEIILSQNADSANKVYCDDLDDDGDMDIVSASWNDDKVAWYENVNGIGNFSAEKLITTQADFINGIFIVDLDDDSDLDIISASPYDDKVAWYDNQDGLGNFSYEKIISENINNVGDVVASDFNGDGYQDIIVGSYPGELVLFKNIGHAIFQSPIHISTAAFGVKDLVATDLDDDGDMDLIYISLANDKISWHKNIDGLGNFSQEIDLSLDINGGIYVEATDIDMDGDVDIIGAARDDNKIIWLENLGILPSNDFLSENLIIHPNPTQRHIKIEGISGVKEVQIFDLSGKLLLSEHQMKLDLSPLKTGIYICRIIANNGDFWNIKISKL